MFGVMCESATPVSTVTPEDEQAAKELGATILDLGISLSKAAGFRPSSNDPGERAQELLKDAIPRVLSSLEADGFL